MLSAISGPEGSHLEDVSVQTIAVQAEMEPRNTPDMVLVPEVSRPVINGNTLRQRLCTAPSVAVPTAGVNGNWYPPCLASALYKGEVPCNKRARTETRTRALPKAPACMLSQEVIAAIESSAQVQFTLIVTDDGFLVNKYADQYRILSCQKFLQLRTLSDAHILFWVDSNRNSELLAHTKSLAGLASHRRTAHFLIPDGTEASLLGIKIPKEVCMFKPGVNMWKSTGPDGLDVMLGPSSETYRVFTEAPTQHCVLAAVTSSEILTVRAGIHQASIVLLLDTGASANFMSGKLAAALDLPVQPDTQGMKVIMADGKTASITGTVITPICIGRYRAKVEFLITDLATEFDAVLGYTWLKRNCDLHLSKGILAFRNGTKVCCVGLPRVGTTEPGRRWHTDSPKAVSGTKAGSLRQQGSAKDRSKAQMPLVGGAPLLSSIQLCKLLRSPGAQAFCLYLSMGAKQLNAMGSTSNTESYVDLLLEEFGDVFQNPPGLPPMRNVAHAAPLMPGSRPPYRRNYRMTELERAELKRQLISLLEKGLIRPSVSPYGSPVIFVRKPNGELRLCIDYRAINKLTVRNRYPLPRVDEILDKLQGSSCFSSLDLAAGYNQIRIHEDDIEKTAITTPFGHWEYLVLPMGMANSPSVFMALMNAVFQGMEDYIVVYLDDICIHSKSPEEHAIHLRAVLSRLREHQLYAKRSKCVFGQATLKFLGHILSADGVKVDPEKIEALQNWPTPSNVTDVRQFVGLANYFRKFVLGLSSLAKPLTDLTKATAPWTWGDEEQAAFDGIKHALCHAPTLIMPDNQKDFTVICDASNFGIGAVLMQDEHPVAYFSKLLNAAQRNYTVTERELLAVVEAVKQWRCYLADKPFTVVTDHSPLTHFATKVDLQGRQARWAEVLARFSFRWEYRPGRTNVADPLSRNPLHRQLTLAALSVTQPKTALRELQVRTRSQAAKSALPAESPSIPEPVAKVSKGSRKPKGLEGATAPTSPVATTAPPPTGQVEGTAGKSVAPLDLTKLEADIAKAYAFDPKFRDSKCNHNWKYHHGFWLDTQGRILVPDYSDLREQVMKAHHNNPFSGHQGRIRTLEFIHRTYHWKGIVKDVQAFVGKCHECQVNKPTTRKPSGLLQPLQIPSRPWGSISVDFVTGFPPVGTNQWDTITVFVDRLTKMVHYVPCREKMSASDFAQVFMANVFRLHGLPLQIISDRDPRFTSVFWQEVTKALGMECGFSTAFHPQTDGQTERMNRTMEEMLRHFITPMRGDWTRALPMLEFAYNNSKHTATQATPFRMYTGLEPLHPASGPADRYYRVPAAELFVRGMSDELARAKQCLADYQSKMKVTADKKRADVHFAVGDRVLLSTKNLKLKGDMPRKMWPRFIGPYKILEAIRGVSYKLELPEGMRIHNVFHVSLLHKYQQGPNMLQPLPVHIVDGELEYTVEAIMAHKVVKARASKKGKQSVKVLFLTAWEGYDRAHDSWEPGEMLQDTEALELYLQAVLARGEVLPPGYTPEGTPSTTPKSNLAAKNKRVSGPSPIRVQEPGNALVEQDAEDGDSPPPASVLTQYKKKRKVTFEVGPAAR